MRKTMEQSTAKRETGGADPDSGKALATSRLLDRGFQTLFSIARYAEGARLTEICRDTTLSRATTLRILRTLLEIEVISLDAAAYRYRLGPAFYRLNANSHLQQDIARLSQHHLDRLREHTGETVCVFQIRDGNRLCIASATSRHDLGMHIHPGQIRPLLAGGPGRILVAYLADSVRAPLMRGLSAKSLEAYKREFTRVRQQRLLITSGEIVLGATAIAAPIFNGSGRVESSLAMIGPTARLLPAQVKKYIPLVKEASWRISREMGWDDSRG